MEVQSGPLAEVSVWWSPRGSGGVEYLLSWAEESGFVSGHLLTDQLTSQLSLWQGQGYYLQVGLRNNSFSKYFLVQDCNFTHIIRLGIVAA